MRPRYPAIAVDVPGGDGRWATGDGRRAMGDGRRATGDGRRATQNSVILNRRERTRATVKGSLSRRGCSRGYYGTTSIALVKAILTRLTALRMTLEGPSSFRRSVVPSFRRSVVPSFVARRPSPVPVARRPSPVAHRRLFRASVGTSTLTRRTSQARIDSRTSRPAERPALPRP